MKSILVLIVAFSILACQPKSSQMTAQNNSAATQNERVSKIVKIEKSDAEWKAELNELEYKVLRKQGTERAFTGDLWDNKAQGIYTCRGCALPLFDSKTKFKSGTGWPSYYQPIDEGHVETDTDYVIGYARTEVHCARCGGHLGHIFNDGPEPTGLRYCINSVSLDFVPAAGDKD
jgi:peptide-methionine (R)-S-oxide reductase